MTFAPAMSILMQSCPWLMPPVAAKSGIEDGDRWCSRPVDLRQNVPTPTQNSWVRSHYEK
ncbi:hypothetical protein NDI52_11185 [Leptolyngbya sp. PL-A3]|nr:hypothetical protein [Leptolyngbya sp. FACHB-8]MBD2153465.1 hypothetical protein [Leptolyngbya sp. FACHB-16]